MISDTLWDVTLMCLLGAFGGLVVGQFIEPREQLMMCVFVGMMIMLIVLTIYYGICAYKEWKREQRKNKRMYRGGYSR